MKKIRQITKSENVQAALVITGFVVTFAVLAIFFLNK